MSKPRNLLFLLVDQWPSESFGFRGSPCATPNMDRLAARGTVFTNAFTTCPLCTPARGALLTGRWPHESGVQDNCGVGYSNQPDLSLDQTTWLDRALGAGHRVGYFGKWHLGTEGLRARKLHGYDRPGESFSPHSERPDYSYEHTKAHYDSATGGLSEGKPPFWGVTTGDADDTRAARACTAGLGFLEDHVAGGHDEPFFLTVSIADPHFPHYLAQSVVDRRAALDLPFPENFGDDFRGKPAFQNGHWWPCHDTTGLNEDDWKHVFDFALRHREYVDAHLGRVLDYLNEAGLTDDTTVVFTSDHGDMCGAHNRFDKGPYYYDEVWRVPLVVAEPGAAAAENAEYVSLIDLGRTFNRRFGSADEPDGPVRIEEQVGVTKPRPVDSREAFGVYDMYNGYWFGIRAVRNERYKYVRNYGDVDEFYDLHHDPHELVNAVDVAKYADEKAALSARLDAFLEEIGDPIADASDLPQPGEIVHTVPYAS